jgi:hypothetical protein
MTASFAVLPFVTFNQQVVSGRSMQPFHYEVLIGNYIVLVALALLIGLFRATDRMVITIPTVILSLIWGLIEVSLVFQANYTLAVRNDEMVPVFVRLRDDARYDGTWEGLREHGRTPALVFSPQYGISSMLPTWAPQGSLLAPGSTAFQTLETSTRKEWLYTHLYYSGKDAQSFSELLNDRAGDPFLTHFARSAIFGPERVMMFLGWDFKPILPQEIEQEAATYGAFVTSFSSEQAAKRPLTYAVILADNSFDFSRIDLWYERYDGELLGSYYLYHLSLRKTERKISQRSYPFDSASPFRRPLTETMKRNP